MPAGWRHATYYNPAVTVYLELTRQFNDGRLRAIISGGQAVVLHRLAIMSKDGDWILREDEEALSHVLAVLSRRGSHYRFGAPLDLRWMAGGWSAHFESRDGNIRVRTDFCTRPPRLAAAEIRAMWTEQEGREYPFVSARLLAQMKKTNREKDYAIIGELARIMPDAGDRLLYSRSARDVIRLASELPALATQLAGRRPVLAHVLKGREALEAALDQERRQLVRANEMRLRAYLDAAAAWAGAWPSISEVTARLPLPEAHSYIVERAEALLPTAIEPP